MNAPLIKTCDSCTHLVVQPGLEPCSSCKPGFPNWAPVVERRVDALQRLHDDQKRLEWCMTVLQLTEAGPGVAHHRAVAMAASLSLGKTGRDALDYAIEGSP